MRKIGYRFNPETLSYDKIDISWRKKLWNATKRFFSSLSLAIIIFIVISNFIDSPKEKALIRENQEIAAQYHLLSNQVNKLDAVLRNLEERDDNIYRVIFESEPLDDNIRRAGSGGVDRYSNFEGLKESELVISTSKKIDELSKALYIQSRSYDDIEKLAKNKVNMLAAIPAIMPISKSSSYYTSSGFGYRMHPILKSPAFHNGIDFAAPIGTSLYATGEGVVAFVGLKGGYGKTVVINHGFNYETYYAHMNSFCVKEGQHIRRGDIIGYVGNTGQSTGAHVHYEVRKDGIPVDPSNYFFNDLTPEEYDELIAKASNAGQSLD